MLGKCPGKGQVECHFVGFPQGRNYSRGIGDAWSPQKPKWAANHKISPETCKNCPKTRKRGAYAKLGKPLGESQVGCHFGKTIIGVSEMPGTPQKQKWAAATSTKQTQKLAKKIKPVTTKYFPLPTHFH